MKCLLKILLILLLGATASKAFAYNLTEDMVREVIIKEVKKEAQKYTDGEVDVKIASMIFTGLKTKSEKAPEIKIVSTQQRFMYRDIKRVMILDGGVCLSSFPVNVTTLVYKDVVVAKDYVNQGEVITGANTQVKRAQVGEYLDKVMLELDPLKPAIATRSLAADSVILKSYIKSKPDIVRNSAVNLLFVSDDGLKIEMDGLAMGEGNIGDLVLVKNTRYNKVHSGYITGKNEVSVKI